MKTQISRFPDSIQRPFSGVYQQQGRMITDADWNALTEIGKTRLDSGLDDIIGKGTPDIGGLVDERENGECALVWGDAYVDGLHAEVQRRPGSHGGADFAFDAQLDFPDPPQLPSAPYVLYLDVWERALTGLEDPTLIDPGLNGADTTTRTRTMAQVKWAPPGFDAENAAQNPPVGDGRLTLTLRAASESRDDCEPCVDEIALPARIGDYLFRVEIHDVGYDDSGAPDRVVLKWSRENGAEVARIGEEPAGFIAGDWIYEFYHGADEGSASESHLGYHHPDTLGSWLPARGALREGYPNAAPAGYSLVRRWDGYAALTKQDDTWSIAIGDFGGEMLPVGKDRGQRLSPELAASHHGHVGEGATLLLSLDTVRVELALADHPHLAGDWWAVAVREAVHTDGEVLLDAAAPMGILHHFMNVACVARDGTLTLQTGDACRRFRFPRLTDLHAEDICFDNTACKMPVAGGTVQGAIDRLCQQRDLRWHNKHLHGWGIVCGLTVQCCPKGHDPDSDCDPQDSVVVSNGYAIDCEGDDIVLDEPLHFDVVAAVQTHDRLSPDEKILTQAQGTACLHIGLSDGEPVLLVEPHDGTSGTFLERLLDGTLLGDFLKDCLFDLLAEINAELSFMHPDTLPTAPEDGAALVPVQQRKLIALANLIAQLWFQQDGRYVWLSPREHDILKEIYDGLAELVQSPTFCAMLEDNPFPDYPFASTDTETWFGRNHHTRLKPSPDGKRVYSYGGGDETINVYDANQGELVEILRVPAAGAAVTAITFSLDGSLLYAAASIKDEDTALAVARVGDEHVWETPPMMFCNLVISEMEQSPWEMGAIYATGIGLGLFLLRPDELRQAGEPRPAPIYAFNAVGQMVIDPVTYSAYATALEDGTSDEPGVYDGFYACHIGSFGPLMPFTPLTGHGPRRTGRDDIAVRSPVGEEEGPRVFVVVDPASQHGSKEIRAYHAGISDPGKPFNTLPVANTQIALAFDPGSDELIASFADGFRLQTMRPDLVVTNGRVPVQLNPGDVAVGSRRIFVQNAFSNTVTAIPPQEMRWSPGRLYNLAQYRYEVLIAFVTLFGSILQYLKDCFCDHLMIKCPECSGDEKIYLACVEIRDEHVYNICNFGKRKYVQTFMAWTYWLSILPIGELIKQAVSRACCAVLPNMFDNLADNIEPPPRPEAYEPAGVIAGTTWLNAQKSGSMMTALTTFNGNDALSGQLGNARMLAMFATDAALGSGSGGAGGVGAGTSTRLLQGKPVTDAEERLRAGKVNVVETLPYSAKTAGGYIGEWMRTPSRLHPGSDAVIYERNGKVVFIAERPTVEATALSQEVEAKIAALTAKVDDASFMAGSAADIAALEARVDGLRAESATEEARLETARTAVAELNAQLTTLNEGLAAATESQTKLRREIEGSRDVTDLRLVDEAMGVALRRAGFRTVADLARADAADLDKAVVGETPDGPAALIAAAKEQLK